MSRKSPIVSVRTSSQNRIPVPALDAYSTSEDTPLSKTINDGILSNDSDPDGDQIYSMLQDSTTKGTLKLASDGSFTYEPKTNFNGTDSFTYRIKDSQNSTSEPVKVTISVTAVNDKPDATDDSYTLLKNETVAVDSAAGVLVNDSDIDGDLIRATIITAPKSGTLTLQENGSFTYKPASNFEGKDSALYIAKDGVVTDTATIQFTVSATPAKAPIAQNDYFTVKEDSILTGANVVTNDSDPDGDKLTATIAQAPKALGSITINEKGIFSYTPKSNFFGLDSFAYGSSEKIVGTFW